MRPALIGRRNPVCLLRHAAEQTNASMTNALKQTRRETLLLGAAALVSSLAQNVEAGHDTERHGISAFGDLKYPPDFKHFDYVNPNAPKGGVFSHTGATRAFNQNFLTFNSLAASS
jgi:microcin C transport system substrate-binding protein